MKIKAIGFDIGGTLVNYNKPLNWSASYKDAIKYMCNKNNIEFTEKKFENAKEILNKYNTRVNPREKEVSSDLIFGEIFKSWNQNKRKLKSAKKSFYEFFQRETYIFEDAKILLEYCKDNSIKCCVYTDVAYGMDDEFSLKDIDKIKEYFDLKLTSCNVGYRKPNKKGFEIMLKEFECKPEEMIYIGDEQKDILGAETVGINTILINREDEIKEYNQDYMVSNLKKVIDIIYEIENF